MKKYGLIGYPLAHSFSKAWFDRKFSEEHLTNCRYDNYEMKDLSGLPALLSDPELEGLNVTIPHKQAVVAYAHALDSISKETGVVNVLKIRRVNKGVAVSGYNTDADGFRMALEPLLEEGTSAALILGTGASSKTAAWVLHRAGIAYRFVSRHPSGDAAGYENLEKVLPLCHLIVNTTPSGMYPHVNAFPPIPYHLLTPRHLLFDFVYNPAETTFLRKGKEAGARTSNGADMLRYQAELAWAIWKNTDHDPE